MTFGSWAPSIATPNMGGIGVDPTGQADMAMMYEKMKQLAQAQNSFPNPTNPTISAPVFTANGRARNLFLARMGGVRADMEIKPGDFLMCHVYGEMVYLFYCFTGREGVVKESWDVFPSDTLITQFRMILA